MTAIKNDQSLAWNSLKQLENEFLLYGKYNVAQLQDIVSTVNGPRYRTLQIEKLLTGQDMHTLQSSHMIPDITGRMIFMHKLHLVCTQCPWKTIRLYEWLLQHLEELLDSIGILSTGYLPPLLFPPTVLKNITDNAIKLVHKLHPDYVLAIDHVTAYYDIWCRWRQWYIYCLPSIC